MAAVAPTNHHHLILSNPFSNTPHDSDDSDEDSDSTPSTPVANPTSSLRAQLQYLLPRHAYFHVLIAINQITNIPLVSGEFAVKWKFKNVYNAPGSKSGKRLLGIVKARRKANRSDNYVNDKGKGKEMDPYEQGDAASLGSGEAVSQRSSSMDGRSASLWSGKSSSSSSSSSSNPSSTQAPTNPSATSPSLPSTSTTSSTTATAASSVPSSLFAGPTLAASPPATTPARGQTAFLPLKDHGVGWEHTLSILVRMDVDRDPQSMLLPCPVKFIILQRDPTCPEIRPTRFGVVNLDLAQYASKGEISRRYLLRESKTNATLKLTTHLTHLPSTSSATPAPTSTSSTSTSTNTFTAPPLPTGEILSGLSNVLAGSSSLGIIGEHDVYRIRPKGLDLYGPYYNQEELEIDLLGGRVTTTSTNPVKKPKKKKGTLLDPPGAAATNKTQTQQPGETTAEAGGRQRGRERSGTQSFDPSRLPLAYGPKTTETLIEALFNPVPTSHSTKESPFTVYTPPEPRTAKSLFTPAATPRSTTSPSSAPASMSFATIGATATSVSSPPPPPLPVSISQSPSTSPSAVSVSPSATATLKGKSRPPGPKRAGSAGIGAGLGIMGLGMGLGVGMGVGVGVSNDARSAEQGGGGGQGDGVVHDKGEGMAGELGNKGTGAHVVRNNGNKEGRRGGSEGGEDVGGKSGGVRGWWKKKTGLSRPGTPVAPPVTVAGMAG